MARVRRSAFIPSCIAVLAIASVLVAAQSPSAPTPQGPGSGVPQAVRDRAARDGRVRVIVELRLSSGASATEGGLMRVGGAAAVLAQRQEIAVARDRVLSRLSAATMRETRRYQTVPLVALEIGPNELNALESSPDVLRVRLDGLMRPSLQASVPRIEGDQTWQAGYDGAGTTIAILDSGVERTHPFLGGKVVEEACFSSTADAVSVSVCPNGESVQIGAGAAAPCAFEECLHGTHVAGIAAGSGFAAGQPFSGVAPGAALVAVQVFSEILDGGLCGGAAPCLGGFESDIIAGLEYVYGLKIAGRNVAAANMSLGGGSFDAPCDGEPFKPAIDNLRAVGVATIVASGNNGEAAGMTSPGCISTAVSVGATTIGDDVAWFANVAPFLSLFAPGDGIVSSILDGDYAALSGTSMAAPHVAGGWALIRQATPTASVDAILAALQNTGRPVTDIRDWAPGTTTVRRIRLFNALASLAPVASPAPSLTAVSPLTARSGVPVVLTLTGSGFNALSVVRWNGVDVATVADSVTSITASVPASLVSLGTAHVAVFNPAPGGGVSSSLPVEVLPPPTLAVSQTTVGPGAPISVTLANGFGGALDWIALASATAPDATYLASTFVGAGALSTTWTIEAPTTPGVYEFRFFLNNGFVRVATSPTFTVDSAVSPLPTLASMSPTDAVAGAASLTLTVHGSRFVASSSVAWNGSPRPTTFVNTTQLTATISAADLSVAGAVPVTVITPAPGGGTSAPLTFTVIPAPALGVNATTVAGGSSVTVTLTNGLGGSLDWISFAQVGAADNNYLEFVYVGAGVTTRTWTVTAPATPGAYEFRLYKQGSLIRAATSPTVTVSSPPSPTLTVSATSIAGGQAVTVTLANGQGGSQDWLSFAAVGAADNAYVNFTYVGAGVTTRTWTVTTPNIAGAYQFRLYKQGGFVRLATSPTVTVTGPPPPSPTLTISQATVTTGASVTVTLANGPGGASDLLALAATGAPDTSYLQSVNIGAGVTSRTWTAAMPSTPGTFEFRLLVNGTTRAATSPTVTVQAAATPQLTVSAVTVNAGAAVTATLTGGLGGTQDWLAFAPVGAANNSYEQFVYVGAGVTSRTWTITTPASAGAYEFRLFQQGSFVRLATSPTVTVQALPAPVLTVSATTVAAGQSVTVTLTNGQGGNQDWFAFAPVGAASNSYVQFSYVGAGVTTRTWTVTAPSTPGNYEFRLFKNGTFTLLATSPAVVVQAAPPPVLTVSTTSAAPGQTVTVTLTNGLGGSQDWLAFAAVGSADNIYVTWTYVGAGVTTRTWAVTMPSTPASYEFRLYRQGSFVRAATSAAVQVQNGTTNAPLNTPLNDR
jgi:subtilisin